MDKPTVIITGCGFKPIGHVFEYNGKPTHNAIDIDGVEHKMNIGTAVAYYLADKGIKVILVSHTEENLRKIKDGLIKLGCNENLISYIVGDLLSDQGISKLVSKLPEDELIYWVQSLGMGGGTYKIPNDNIYLPFEQISPELIEYESKIVSATHRMMLRLMPIFRKQIQGGQSAKISIITSMSGERGYHFGATHVAAKHALVGYIKGIEKELEDEGVEVHDIRPGCIDTGMYDNPYTINSVTEIVKRTKMYPELNNERFIPAKPMEVAEAVYDSLFGKDPKKVYRILGPYQR